MVVDSSSFHKHPQYDVNIEKINARLALINYYTELTGAKSTEGQYWTLCSEQSNLVGSEIEQLTRAGFIKKEQFYGVDINEKKIARNKAIHPEAHWFVGDWVGVLKANRKIYNPSIVYLDSSSVAKGNILLDMVTATLEYTQSGVVFVNMMMNNPRSGKKYNLDDFLKLLLNNISDSTRLKWCQSKNVYVYNCSNRTDMLTTVFMKGV